VGPNQCLGPFSSCPYSPECVEGVFYEVQVLPLCCGAHTAPAHIPSLRQEYAAFVACIADAS